MTNHSTRKAFYQKARKFYEDQLRVSVETPENIGKMISIEPESGDYAISEDALVAAATVQARHPGALLYGGRIGYDAAYAVGGTLKRTSGE